MPIEIYQGPSPSILQDTKDSRYLPSSGQYIGYVPLSLIYRGDVPVDPSKINMLAAMIREEAAAKPGTTGQLAPILLAEIRGFGAYPIIDGFHRDGALQQLKRPYAFALITPELNWPEVTTQRIRHAISTEGIVFARVIAWMGKAWSYAPWADHVTSLQAFELASSEGMTGKNLGINPQEADGIRRWVETQSVAWKREPGTILDYLRTAEKADPKLIFKARSRAGGSRLEAPTPKHIKLIAESLPKRFELQRVVVDATLAHNLTAEVSGILASEVSKVLTVVEARQIVETGNWKRLLEKKKQVYPDTKSLILTKAAELRRLAEMQPDDVMIFNNDGVAPQLDEQIISLFDESSTSLRNIKEGERIFLEGDPIDYIMFVRTGSILVYARDPYNGRRLVYDILDPYSIIGAEGLLGQNFHLNSAEAFTDCRLNFLKPNRLAKMIQDHPAVASFLFLAQTKRIQEIDRRMRTFAKDDVESRVATVLMDLASRSIPSRMAQDFIGELTGYSRESVNKTIVRMQEQGAIVWGRRGPEMLHKAKIKAISEV